MELKLADRRVQYLVDLTKNEKKKNCSRQSDIICLPAKIQLGLTGKVRRRGMGRWDWPKAPPCQWDWPKGACDGKVWSLPTATPRGLARLNTMLDTMKAFTYVVWIFWYQERIHPESLLGISPKSCFERYWDRDWRPWWPCASSLPQRSWACSLCCFADRLQGPWYKILEAKCV